MDFSGELSDVGKLIWVALGIVIVWWLLARARSKPASELPPRAVPPEDMVRCGHCGVHLPRSESFQSRGKFFCSEEHLRMSS